MKKLFVLLMLTALTVSSVWGATLSGDITKIVVMQGGDIEISINNTAGKKIRAANANKKEMYAMLLTAYTAGETVKITHDEGIIKTVAMIAVP